MAEQEGEVEKKVNDLAETVFDRFNKDGKNVNKDGQPFITKDDLMTFVQEIMQDAGEEEAFNEEDFNKGYYEFDTDASG